MGSKDRKKENERAERGEELTRFLDWKRKKKALRSHEMERSKRADLEAKRDLSLWPWGRPSRSERDEEMVASDQHTTLFIFFVFLSRRNEGPQ